MNRQAIASILAIVYIAIMGAGMYLMYHRYGLTYGSAEEVQVIVWVELVLTALVIAATALFFSFRGIGFTRPDYGALKWMIPQLLMLAALMVMVFLTLADKPPSPDRWRLIALSGFTTLLVGFSEEAMFRGVVLHLFARGLTIIHGVLISSVLFSLLHAVNILGGATMEGTAGQLGLTFLFGMYFALAAIKLGSILPLILFHWLWDFCIVGFGEELGAAGSLLALALAPVNLAMIVLLLRNMRGELRTKLAGSHT